MALDVRQAAVVLSGALDVAATDVLERAVRELRVAGVVDVVVDLRGVELLDSCGLRALLALRNDAKRCGQRLTLVPGPRRVQRVFELSRTWALFEWSEPPCSAAARCRHAASQPGVAGGAAAPYSPG